MGFTQVQLLEVSVRVVVQICYSSSFGLGFGLVSVRLGMVKFHRFVSIRVGFGLVNNSADSVQDVGFMKRVNTGSEGSITVHHRFGSWFGLTRSKQVNLVNSASRLGQLSQRSTRRWVKSSEMFNIYVILRFLFIS
ncbi:hypothetical protein Hanom_Chr11g01014931 [Helianthus anomalus]